jgi:hypothetical protein
MNELEPRRATSAQSTGAARAVLLAAGALVLGASLVTGLRGFAADLRQAYRGAPRHAIPPELVEEARMIEARVPAGASIAYVGNQEPPDVWFSRLWQRALYPRRVLLFDTEPRASNQPRVQALEASRAAYSIRYAISAGNPPRDPGFLSRVELPPIPGYPYVLWFGELAP